MTVRRPSGPRKYPWVSRVAVVPASIRATATLAARRRLGAPDPDADALLSLGAGPPGRAALDRQDGYRPSP